MLIILIVIEFILFLCLVVLYTLLILQTSIIIAITIIGGLIRILGCFSEESEYRYQINPLHKRCNYRNVVKHCFRPQISRYFYSLFLYWNNVVYSWFNQAQAQNGDGRQQRDYNSQSQEQFTSYGVFRKHAIEEHKHVQEVHHHIQIDNTHNITEDEAYFNRPVLNTFFNQDVPEYDPGNNHQAVNAHRHYLSNILLFKCTNNGLDCMVLRIRLQLHSLQIIKRPVQQYSAKKELCPVHRDLNKQPMS